MSTSVKFSTTSSSEIPVLELIPPEKYAFGHRDNEQNFHLAEFAQITIIFDKQKIGRGVELTFEDNYIEVRLCAPSTSADYDIFTHLVAQLAKLLDAKEFICEEENFDIQFLDTAYQTAKTNMRSALDFITSAPLHQTGPIALLGVFQEFKIDPSVQSTLRKGGQAAFNTLLYKSQQSSYETAIKTINDAENESK